MKYLALLFLIAGGVLGYSVSSVMSPRRAMNHPKTEDSNIAASSNRDSSHEAVTPVEPEPAVSDTVASDPGDPAPPQFGQVVRKLYPDQEIPTYQGEIRGRICLKDQTPLPGIELVATSKTWRRRPRAKASDLSEHLKDSVKSYQGTRAAKTRATTNEAGEFVLQGIQPADPYWVTPRHKDYEFELVGQTSNEAFAGDLLEYCAHPKGTVIIDIQGAAKAASWEVRCRRENQGWDRYLTWTPKAREHRLRSGRYTIYAVAGDYKTDKKVVIVNEPDKPVKVDLEVTARRGIRGKVVYENGEALNERSSFIPELRVLISPVSSASEADPSVLAQARDDGSTGSNGTFERLDLEPGTYLIGVERLRGRIEDFRTVEVSDEVVEIELRLRTPDPSEVVRFRVTSETGEAIKVQSIEIRFETTTGGETIEHQVLNREPGEISLLVADGFWTALESPRIELKATLDFENYGSKRISVEGRVTDVIVRPPGGLLVTVTNPPSDLAVIGTLTPVTTETSEGVVNFFQSLDNTSEVALVDGQMTLGPFESGEYDLEISVKAGSWERQTLVSERLYLNPGQNLYNTTLPPLYTVSVDFGEGAGMATILNVEQFGFRGNRNFDIESGAPAKIENLPPGKYCIQLMRPPEMTYMDITVSGNQTFTYEPSPLNALRVVVRDESSTLAELGFQNGDLIVGADASRFQNAMHLQTALMRMQSEPELTLLLERNGSEESLLVKSQRLFKILMKGGASGLLPGTQTQK